MSGDVGTSSPMARATKRDIERSWAVEGSGPTMFSLRIATDQRWDASACVRPGIPILDPLASYMTRAFASVLPDLGLPVWDSATVLKYNLKSNYVLRTLSAIYAWKHYPTNCAFLSPTVTLLSETTSTADCNVDANYYCLFEEKNSEKTEG